jgi:hypothetical protein
MFLQTSTIYFLIFFFFINVKKKKPCKKKSYYCLLLYMFKVLYDFFPFAHQKVILTICLNYETQFVWICYGGLLYRVCVVLQHAYYDNFFCINKTKIFPGQRKVKNMSLAGFIYKLRREKIRKFLSVKKYAFMDLLL